MREGKIGIFLLGILALFLITLMHSAAPASAQLENVTQAEITEGEDTSISFGQTGNITVQGGNISEVNISHRSQTDWWHGVWGTVLVNFTLDDASGNTFYNWGVTNASGEIYFSNESVLSFTLANATDENLTYAQSTLNWAPSTSVDNLTNTYSNSNGHQAFTANGFSVQQDSTPAVNMQTGHNCTMLWRTDVDYPVFAAPLTTGLSSFNGQSTSYECLLPVRSVNAVETYFVYAELT